ncbi:MAG TPA: hypothetical protein VHA52_12440, partial [Candidatus Babeliaceae bacterium]|nr:hypothetical protein [Candidatus Babeliaceae bacterium]
YAQFYDYEIAHRHTLSYPPCNRLADIELQNVDPELLDKEAQAITDYLEAIVKEKGMNIKILGPTYPVVHKIQNISLRKIYLKSSSVLELLQLLNLLKSNVKIKSTLLYTPNPL